MPVSVKQRSHYRKELLKQRLEIDGALRSSWDSQIRSKLLSLLYERTKVVALYWPIRAEPDLRPLASELKRLHISCALPVTQGIDQPLKFALWEGDRPLRPAAFGVMIPEHCDWVNPDTVIVPCLGFDAACYRLGYGGGYYDRTLAQLKALSLGVAYEFQNVGELEVEPHDQALHAVVTEQGVTIRDQAA